MAGLHIGTTLIREVGLGAQSNFFVDRAVKLKFGKNSLKIISQKQVPQILNICHVFQLAALETLSTVMNPLEKNKSVRILQWLDLGIWIRSAFILDQWFTLAPNNSERRHPRAVYKIKFFYLFSTKYI